MLLEWLLDNEQMRGASRRFGRVKRRRWTPEQERELARWVRSNSAFRELATRVESERLERLDAAFERWLSEGQGRAGKA